jgi:glycine dehydrogenase
MPRLDGFERRHLGVNLDEVAQMLKIIGADTLDQLIDETIPDNIRSKKALNVSTALTEAEYLAELSEIANKNKVFKNYIGQGYYGTNTPSVILRNIFQNPGWYTQYTPYQAEIAQGRLEALLNFQTVVSDLTGLPIANASLLDEGTAAAEAMAMFEGIRNKKRKEDHANKIYVDVNVFGQTLDVLVTRAEPLDIIVEVGDWKDFKGGEEYIGLFIQYPDAIGNVNDYKAMVEKCKAEEILVCVMADLLSLTLLTPPGEWGADVVVGNTQRFGVPMGYGGPHAAYFATNEEHKRIIPGRIIGVSIDSHNDRALRMALQTREQHIRREKATSNICTAQALLAIMAGMYAVYHGAEGLRDIAQRINNNASRVYGLLQKADVQLLNDSYFDTLSFKVSSDSQVAIKKHMEQNEINLFYGKNGLVSISIDESISEKAIDNLLVNLGKSLNVTSDNATANKDSFDENLKRKSVYLTHEVFSNYHTETKMMRYIKSLENKDLSLVHSMISLGSCTMKLNAASELIPVSWPQFANMHPFAPKEQAKGYYQIFEELEKDLAEITGFTACSLQPNSGAQGEYAGLLTIRAYHQNNGQGNRNIALIPSSAHGTNPASAVMTGMKVVVVACDEKGNVDFNDLEAKTTQYKDTLACMMITYPSTHGVFEKSIIAMCKLVHDNGGLVYMDGANMNAQVGLTSPGLIGADVCHLNLHKTFAIPHGGGGPGMGPICVNDKLKPFLPGHVNAITGGEKGIHAVSSAPWGSASILLISYGYIKMLGVKGLTNATKVAILNANYMKVKLEGTYTILYRGENGRAAHEFILDLRPYKNAGISAEDVAKRLIDYGFHSPTLSFPVAGTIMIEPTESESLSELDRFCDALIEIKNEIDEIARGEYNVESNVLTNAPHTLKQLTANEWHFEYSREKAAYPLEYLKGSAKFWATVGRVDNAHGDRNLVCTCPPIEMYQE